MNKRDATRRNYLLRVQAVQEEYRLHKIEGLPDSFVWRKYIYGKFFISERTFREYLGISVKMELNKITDQ